jgi:hypothetical protein
LREDRPLPAAAPERDHRRDHRTGQWRVRAAGADGIIDRSRQIAGGWHLNLFRWNELGGPKVEIAGNPVPGVLTADGPKWGL